MSQRVSLFLVFLGLCGCGNGITNTVEMAPTRVKLDGLHRQIHQHEYRESNKALVTKELFDKFQLRMSQEEVIALIEAPASNPVRKHEAKLEEIHFLELNEEGRKIILRFQGNALIDKEQIGIE